MRKLFVRLLREIESEVGVVILYRKAKLGAVFFSCREDRQTALGKHFVHGTDAEIDIVGDRSVEIPYYGSVFHVILRSI